MHCSPIKAPQPLVFLSREQHNIVSAVAGHNYCFTVSDASEATKLALKLACGYACQIDLRIPNNTKDTDISYYAQSEAPYTLVCLMAVMADVLTEPD